LTASHLSSHICHGAAHNVGNGPHEWARGWTAHQSSRNSADTAHQLRSSAHYCRRRSCCQPSRDRNEGSDESFRLFFCFSFGGGVSEMFHERFVVNSSLRIDLVFAFELKLALEF
jgi:hypothetical protein